MIAEFGGGRDILLDKWQTLWDRREAIVWVNPWKAIEHYCPDCHFVQQSISHFITELSAVEKSDQTFNQAWAWYIVVRSYFLFCFSLADSQITFQLLGPAQPIAPSPLKLLVLKPGNSSISHICAYCQQSPFSLTFSLFSLSLLFLSHLYIGPHLTKTAISN